MKISAAKKHLINAYHKKIPAITWGLPGIGKSSIIKQVSKELNVDLIDLRLPQLEPPDLRGIPVPNKETKKIEWYHPEFFPNDGKGILFLDELEKSSHAVKNAALQLILDRKMGKYVLPEGWSIMAACNREEDGAFSQGLGSALGNRFMHLNIEPDLDEWIKWGRQHGIRDEIIAYLIFRPEHLHKYDPDAKAFPSPRTWEMLNTMLQNVENPIEQSELLEAVVGKNVGYEYRTWLNVYRNVNVEDIVLKGQMPNFEKTEKGKEKSFIYAVTIAVAHYIKQRKNFEGIEANTVKFVSSLNAEMQAVFCKQIPTGTLGKMIENKAFRAIASNIMDIIFAN